jgi:two-component system response regulator DesR
MITIAIAEDQALVRDAIATLLDLESDIEVVGSFSDGKQMSEWLASSEPLPDIILSDIEMPNMTGIELAEYCLKSHYPCKFVIMTTFAKPGYIQRAMSLGVKGFTLKEASSDYLVESIKKVNSGLKVIDPELALSALGEHDPLTDKERKALQLAGEGLKTKEIAEKLFLSEGTVRNYLSEAISKLNATNRVDASRIAKQKGWL